MKQVKKIRLREPILSERSIGTWLKKYCDNRGYRVVKLNPSLHNGLPDRLIMTKEGKVVFAELKSKGATLRPLQIYWVDWLRENGHQVIVIDEITEETEDIFDSCFKGTLIFNEVYEFVGRKGVIL